ncbi:MAG TPA: zinc-dependent metalloprotease [Vicinamibacterales bacterium]|nr:zinc-dependent metalloprotease [Vicinamibacterales bacterium]
MFRTPVLRTWMLAVASVSVLTLSAGGDIVRAVSQTPQTPQQQEPEQTGGRGGRGGQQAPPAPRPYAQVITAAARTDDGIVKVHRVGETLYYEIPKAQLGKDFLWNTQIKKTTIGAGYGGQAAGSRVVRWVTKGDRVLLLSIDYSLVADQSNPIYQAVDDANYPTIIRAFNVAAYSPSGDPVIDVTPLFLTDVPEISVRGRIGGRGMDPTRSFIERTVSFPENVNVEVTQTFTANEAAGGAGEGRGRGELPGRGMRGSSGTVLTHHSMVKLPENRMMGRLFDERVGYFTQGFTDYGAEDHRSVAKRYITRYRLEKKDTNAAVSEPVRPIVYYVDPATPPKWVPFIKKGIEDWQVAFEAAGFRKAIVAAEAPKNDPEWSAEDARYSVIRWLPSTTENASGPHVHDPRTGEILEADIQFYHNVQNLAKNWYFVQAGPLDPRARKLPLPDDLMGELMRYVVAHEVGHTLGFQHNMKASSAYTIEQIRDPKWVKEMGHTPTLMDYSRFNYVAQPEDKIDPADLIPKIGPYDKWATMWGYKPIPEARTPDQERPTLDKWAREQDDKPYLRFSTEGAEGSDPGDQTEAVGDIDAVRATTLGLKNLGRVSEMLFTATSTKVGDPWTELEEVYGRMVSQWQLEMNHVVRVIGAFNSQQKHIGQQGVRFTTVPRARQSEALKFLLENAFTTPGFMIQPDVLRRIQASGVVERVRTAQNSVLSNLLQAARLDRMVEQEALDGSVAYPPLQFLSDLRKGVWSELAKPATPIGIYRRNLHRSYLDTIDTRLNGTTAPSDEVRALFRGELRALDAEIRKALPLVADEVSRRHLVDARDQIAQTLDPRAMRTRAPDPAAGRGGRGGLR